MVAPARGPNTWEKTKATVILSPWDRSPIPIPIATPTPRGNRLWVLGSVNYPPDKASLPRLLRDGAAVLNPETENSELPTTTIGLKTAREGTVNGRT